MLLPLSVMAMTPVTDSTLSDVTGQAGVSINADLMMNIQIGTMSWGDEDGLVQSHVAENWWPAGASTEGGYVGITNFNLLNLRIKARDDAGESFNGYWYTDLKPITIDVATDTAATPLYGGATFVRFGLGALMVTMDDLSMGVMLDDYTCAGDITGGMMMGTVNVGGLALYFNPDSYVDIYAHAGCGVNFTMDIIIDEFALEYVSWGDTDGLQQNPSNLGAAAPWFTYGGQGYVGLANISMGVIEIAGTVAIDVVTSSAGLYAHGTFYKSNSIVHIAFNGFSIDVDGPITADVCLANNGQLTGVQVGTLGDIYISGMSVDILNGSWVDIWAH